MAMPPTEFIAATIPAKVEYVSGSTLFHIAMRETGDALQWVAIGELNDMPDPWVNMLTKVLIPPVFPSGTQTGIFGL